MAGGMRTIPAALAEVNGKATQHTFTTFHEIANLALDADKALRALGLSKSWAKGAHYVAESGIYLPGRYKYPAKGTIARLEYRTRGRYLINVTSYDLWPKYKPRTMLLLTPMQDQRAVPVLQQTYAIRAPAPAQQV
jgi:hypothetical protein